MDPFDRPDQFPSGDHLMIEMTEVRWFAERPLPPAVSSWFTKDGAVGVVEQRCDLYWLDGRSDVGLKLRDRSTLELKIRQSSAELVPALDGAGEQFRGALEVWRKWSPADGLVSPASEPSVEVQKSIVKRRFSITGEEDTDPAFADPPAGPFCDVEIVAVDDGVTKAWSFAFTAHGPRGSRRANIDAAWRTLLSVAPPAEWPSKFAASCGYPEWLNGRIRVGSQGAER